MAKRDGKSGYDVITDPVTRNEWTQLHTKSLTHALRKATELVRDKNWSQVVVVESGVSSQHPIARCSHRMKPNRRNKFLTDKAYAFCYVTRTGKKRIKSAARRKAKRSDVAAVLSRRAR